MTDKSARTRKGKTPAPPEGGDASSAPAFEESLGRLEEIVGRLEEGDLSLDESLRLFQEGVELSRRCSSVLDQAQRKIEQLVQAADGSLKAEPLEAPGGGDASGDAAPGRRRGGRTS